MPGAFRKAIAAERLADVTIVAGVHDAIIDADAAWVSSGTAVLETALSGVPSIALYIINPLLVRHARRVYSGKYIALPNLVAGREIVPEFLQTDATPANLAQAMDRILSDPAQQYLQFDALRTALGPADALQRCARFAVELARAERV